MTGTALYDQAADLYRKIFELGGKLNSSQASEFVLPGGAMELSFIVSYVLDIGAGEKQRLLEMTSTAERLSTLVTHMEDAISNLEQQLAYKTLMLKARGNGDLGKPHQE